MARQYAITVEYTGGFTANLFWHDNDTVEFVNIPQTVQSDFMSVRVKMLQEIIANFMKIQRVERVEIDKL